jgi:hypothetical protein
LAPKLYGLRDASNHKFDYIKAKGFKPTNNAKSVLTYESFRSAIEQNDDGTYNELPGITYLNFVRQKYGGIYVLEEVKHVSHDPSIQKGLLLSNNMIIPFGPHCERPEEGESLVKRRKRPPPNSLPPVRYERRLKLGSYKGEKEIQMFEDEVELSDNEAEAMMQAEIESQDQRRQQEP